MRPVVVVLGRGVATLASQRLVFLGGVFVRTLGGDALAKMRLAQEDLRYVFAPALFHAGAIAHDGTVQNSGVRPKGYYLGWQAAFSHR